MKSTYYLIFLTRFGVSGIPRITTASEASHELMKSYLLVPNTLLHPNTCSDLNSSVLKAGI